ncbi:MAG: flagellar export chaperone FliS [Gammaproteobacteria bacterium]|nr:flagellar export chaperone FliS [Gammaproteobacteria bacterium]
MNVQKRRAISNYTQVAATNNEDTKTPHELIKLLFDGLTDRIASARSALAKEDREERAKAVTKAQTILWGLRDSLDFKVGGELAVNLDSLYEYCLRRLTTAHAKEDDEIFSEVMDLMVSIRDAWRAIPATTELAQVQ